MAYDLDRLKRLFGDARDLTAEARRRSDQCFDYYDNRQLSSDYIKALRKRRQPEIWVNRIAPAVNGILGVLEQGQTDPKAYPRTTADDDAAEIATDSLRYAAENARWGRTKAATCKDYLIGGIGAVIVEVDAKGDPLPRKIRWGEFFYDPHSRDPDFGDARYMGVAKWMYVDDAKRMFPQQAEEAVLDEETGEVIQEARITREEIDLDAIGPIGLAWDDEDKPLGSSWGAWGDRKLKRVLIVEMYYRDGEAWRHCVFYGGGILQDGESEYQDEDGKPCNPIEAQSANVDRDNNRYGVVIPMIPVQDEINMRRSKLLHLVNQRQVRVVNLDMTVDIETARREAARPDGVLPANVDIVQTADMAAGQAQLLAEAKSELERFGPAPGVLGRQSAESSGRAQLVRQQAGLVELSPILAGIEDLELRVYRQMWARIRQFWTEPKLVRVTDEVGAVEFMQVNEPIMGPPQVVLGPNNIPVLQPTIQGYKNRPVEMDMDIIIDATPDTANVQQEQFTELVKLAGIYGAQEVPFEDLIKVSNLPHKRELLDSRKERQEQASQGQGAQQQMQQIAFQSEMENKAADTELKRANALKSEVGAQVQQADALLKAYQAGGASVQPPPGSTGEGSQPT